MKKYRYKLNDKEQPENFDEQDSMYYMQEAPRTPLGIEVEENRIYFYTSVGDREALELNRLIRRLDVEMKYLSSRLDGPKVPIHLHINSPGGSVFAGLSIVDTMRNCSVPIYTYVEGSVASAASLISSAGQKGKRFIGENSFMLVHQPYMEWSGKRDEFIDEIQNQEKIFAAIKKIYMSNCKFKDDEHLEELLQHELWLDSKQCIELGLVDKISSI